MKLIIDISKEHYERIKWVCENGMGDSLQKRVANGTPIPDNATNGDVIKALFEPTQVERIEDGVIVENYDFSKEWWNSLYQKGGKE